MLTSCSSRSGSRKKQSVIGQQSENNGCQISACGIKWRTLHSCAGTGHLCTWWGNYLHYFSFQGTKENRAWITGVRTRLKSQPDCVTLTVSHFFPQVLQASSISCIRLSLVAFCSAWQSDSVVPCWWSWTLVLLLSEREASQNSSGPLLSLLAWCLIAVGAISWLFS